MFQHSNRIAISDAHCTSKYFGRPICQLLNIMHPSPIEAVDRVASRVASDASRPTTNEIVTASLLRTCLEESEKNQAITPALISPYSPLVRDHKRKIACLDHQGTLSISLQAEVVHFSFQPTIITTNSRSSIKS